MVCESGQCPAFRRSAHRYRTYAFVRREIFEFEAVLGLVSSFGCTCCSWLGSRGLECRVFWRLIAITRFHSGLKRGAGLKEFLQRLRLMTRCLLKARSSDCLVGLQVLGTTGIIFISSFLKVDSSLIDWAQGQQWRPLYLIICHQPCLSCQWPKYFAV